MFSAIHQHLKQYVIQNFSLTLVVKEQWPRSCYNAQDSIFSRTTIHHFHSMSNTFTTGNLIFFHLSSSIAFLIKRGKIHVKNTEKPTFLILKDDSILRTTLSESPITSLKFEHLSNQRTETTLWLVRDTYPNAAIWLVRNTYLKRSDWC